VDYISFTPSTSNNWMRAMQFVHKEKPWLYQRIMDSFTQSQLESKIWLREELSKIKPKVDNVSVLGGWYCHILCNILFEDMSAKYVMNYDIDRDSKKLSYKFNRRYKDEGRFFVSNRNLFTEKIEDRMNKPDVFINPSCEHMYYMSSIVNKHFDELERPRPLFVLQSTDDDQYDDHINCVSGPDELAEQAGLINVYYSGVKVLDNGMNRFMVIGK
jgi:hypothetical protein